MANLEVTKNMMTSILQKMENIEQNISKQGTAIFEMRSEHRSQMSMNQSQDDSKYEGGIDLSPQFAKHSAKHIDIKLLTEDTISRINPLVNDLMRPLKDNDGYKGSLKEKDRKQSQLKKLSNEKMVKIKDEPLRPIQENNFIDKNSWTVESNHDGEDNTLEKVKKWS